MISIQAKISLFPVCFLVAALAYGQAPGTMQQAAPGQFATTQSTPSQPAANPALADTVDPTPSFADQAFVEDTLRDDQSQVQMSKLAEQKASSDDVKQFSQKMVNLHNQLDHQLAPLARKLSVSEPKKPSKKQKEELARLAALSGPDFDTAYLQAMARTQQHTLKEFRQEASSQNPAIRQATKIDTPTLGQNFDVLQKLAQTHNVTLDAKN